MINVKQIDCHDDPTRHRVMFCGRRGGKTYLLRENICQAAVEAPRGVPCFYIGPSNAHSMELMWDPIGEWLHTHKIRHQARISKGRYELPGKRRIYIMGAEKASRIRGHRAYFVAGDEFAYWKKLGDAWNKDIRPALSDMAGVGKYGGRALFGTTPAGKGTEAYEFYLAALKSNAWAVHSWTTLDNPWIDPQEVADAREELTQYDFEQEYEAKWGTAALLAYYGFNEKIHMVKQPEITLFTDLKLCFDFNVNPTTLLLSQYDPEAKINRYKREFSLKNSSTEDTLLTFCEEFEDRKHKLKLLIRGDASGRARSSTTGKSDYYYVESILREKGFHYTMEVPARNPAIIDRVKHVNGWLKPFSGKHKVEIDPSCVDLIKDFASQASIGRIPDKGNNMGHKADAAGYDVHWSQMTQQARPQRTIQL